MAPRNDVPQEGADRARRAQHDDARVDPAGGFRGTADRPFHVRIIGADDSFYEAFRRPGGAARGDQSRRADTEVSGAGFESMLSDARAIQAASLQTVRNLQLAGDAAQQFTRRMTAEAERSRRETQGERLNVEEILLRMERMFDREREERHQDRQGERGRRNRPPAPDEDWRDDRPYPEPIPLDEDDDGTNRPPDTPDSRRGGGRRRRRREADPDDTNKPDEPRPDVGPQSFADRVQALRDRRAAAHRAGQTTHHDLSAMARAATGEFLHERFGEGTSRTPTLVAQHDENGVLTHYNQHHPDGTVERIETDDDRVPGLVRTAGRMAAVSGASSALAAGGFGAAARAVPYAGTTMAVASSINEAAVWLTEQRAKNAQYQAVYGGDNWEGLGGRMQEEGFMWGQRLTTGMTEEDSRKLFKGVTSLGYSGQERGDRLDFATEGYRNLGISVEQSLSGIAIAAKNANTNLSAVQRGFTSVSLAARATGQNAETLRNQFLQTYAGLNQVGLGNASASLAAGLTNATTGVNRQFDQINTSGVGNTTALRIAAAQTGQTYGQLLAGEQKGDTELARTIDAQTGQAYRSSVGPSAQQAAAGGIAAKGGGQEVQQSPGAQHSIALEVMQQPDWDSQVVAENLYAQTAGQIDVRNADPTVVAEQYVSYMSGTRIEAQQKTAQAGQDPKDLTRDDREWGGIFNPGGGQSKFVASHYEDDLSWGGFFGSSNDDAVGAYEDRQKKTNQSDPVLEDLINTYGKDSDVGFEVETAGGKRVVSLDEGIQYYADQLAKGTATVVGGEDDGRTVEDAVGYSQKGFTPTDGGSGDSTKSEEHGKTVEDWKNDHKTDATDAKASQAKVTIEATDELRRMFNFTGQGVTNSQVEAGASSGSTPYLSSGPR